MRSGHYLQHFLARDMTNRNLNRSPKTIWVSIIVVSRRCRDKPLSYFFPEHVDQGLLVRSLVVLVRRDKCTVDDKCQYMFLFAVCVDLFADFKGHIFPATPERAIRK